MNKSLKESIFYLYNKGYSYKKIVNELKCNIGTVSYHLSKYVKVNKEKSELAKQQLIETIKCNLPKDRNEFKKLYFDKLTAREIQYFYNEFYKLPNKGTKKNNVPKEYYQLKRVKLKKQMVESKGGCCELCGYSKSLRALQFHHRDPNEKDFNIGGKTSLTEIILKELDKCMLVCSNCHSEIHDNNIE